MAVLEDADVGHDLDPAEPGSVSTSDADATGAGSAQGPPGACDTIGDMSEFVRMTVGQQMHKIFANCVPDMSPSPDWLPLRERERAAAAREAERLQAERREDAERKPPVQALPPSPEHVRCVYRPGHPRPREPRLRVELAVVRAQLLGCRCPRAAYVAGDFMGSSVRTRAARGQPGARTPVWCEWFSSSAEREGELSATLRVMDAACTPPLAVAEAAFSMPAAELPPGSGVKEVELRLRCIIRAPLVRYLEHGATPSLTVRLRGSPASREARPGEIVWWDRDRDGPAAPPLPSASTGQGAVVVACRGPLLDLRDGEGCLAEGSRAKDWVLSDGNRCAGPAHRSVRPGATIYWQGPPSRTSFPATDGAWIGVAEGDEVSVTDVTPRGLCIRRRARMAIDVPATGWRYADGVSCAARPPRGSKWCAAAASADSSSSLEGPPSVPVASAPLRRCREHLHGLIQGVADRVRRALLRRYFHMLRHWRTLRSALRAVSENPEDEVPGDLARMTCKGGMMHRRLLIESRARRWVLVRLRRSWQKLRGWMWLRRAIRAAQLRALERERESRTRLLRKYFTKLTLRLLLSIEFQPRRLATLILGERAELPAGGARDKVAAFARRYAEDNAGALGLSLAPPTPGRPADARVPHQFTIDPASSTTSSESTSTGGGQDSSASDEEGREGGLSANRGTVRPNCNQLFTPVPLQL